MAALTNERNTKRRPGSLRTVPVAAGVKIFNGALVVVDATGYGRPGRVSTTDKALGRATETVDNTAGAAGDLAVTVETGVFAYGNSAAADLVARKDIGANAYIVDDQTVALTDGTATRSVAGKIFDVDSDGVWIGFNH